MTYAEFGASVTDGTISKTQNIVRNICTQPNSTYESINIIRWEGNGYITPGTVFDIWGLI